MELWRDVYYHGVKQDWPAIKDSSSEKVNSDISNIAGTSKITRSGRIFSLEIAPPKAVYGPVIIPVVTPPKVVPSPTIISTNTPIEKAVTTPVITPTDTPAAMLTETRGKVFWLSLSRRRHNHWLSLRPPGKRWRKS